MEFYAFTHTSKYAERQLRAQSQCWLQVSMVWLGLAWLGLVLFDFDCFGLKYCIK